MTSTPTRPFDNVVITTKGLQDRNINILDGTTVENKGKLILTEIFPFIGAKTWYVLVLPTEVRHWTCGSNDHEYYYYYYYHHHYRYYLTAKSEMFPNPKDVYFAISPPIFLHLLNSSNSSRWLLLSCYSSPAMVDFLRTPCFIHSKDVPINSLFLFYSSRFPHLKRK